MVPLSQSIFLSSKIAYLSAFAAAKVVAFLLVPSFVHASMPAFVLACLPKPSTVPAFVVLVPPVVLAVVFATPFGTMSVDSTMHASALAFESSV